MPTERKQIVKPYLLLCEGRDAERFLINYLNSDALRDDDRFSNEIQVFDFGGNDDLSYFLMNLMNMDRFGQVKSIAILRDAEKDFYKACKEINNTLIKCGFAFPKMNGTWVHDDKDVKIGYYLFPMDDNSGTLEDLCLQILTEENNKGVLSAIDTFLVTMESTYGRRYSRKHKNRLHVYLSSSDRYVAMPLGTASSAGAFDWTSDKLKPLRIFLEEGFSSLL